MTETETVTLQDVVDEAVSLARGMRATGAKLCVRVQRGGTLPPPLERYPNGIGVVTFYGVCFETDWRVAHEPFYESLVPEEAGLVLAAVNEQKEVTWRITRQTSMSPGPEIVGDQEVPEDPDDLLISDQEAEPMLRIKQRTRRPRGIGGDGLPQRKSSRGSRSGTSRTRGT